MLRQTFKVKYITLKLDKKPKSSTYNYVLTTELKLNNAH